MANDTLSSLAELIQATGWNGVGSIFPADFQDALANNRPPRPAVLQTARAFRENPTLFSTASKKRIGDIDKVMKALQGERDKLADEEGMRATVMEACATVCAPARRLPKDILHEIAHYAVAKWPSPERTEAPLSLSHVSSAWRSVVLHSPLLWTDLYLRVEDLDYHSIVKSARAVNAWFRRAGSLPVNLYLYVDCEITSDADEAHNFNLFLKAIAPWASRVARLGIGGQHWVNLMTQFADVEWELPNLHTLEILGQSICDREIINHVMEPLEALAPRITMFHTSQYKLKTLIANQEIAAYFSAFSFLPWHSLTTIILKEDIASCEELRKLLISCPQIHTASLRWVEPGPDLGMSAQPTPLTTLKRLSVEVGASTLDDLPRLFSGLTFPSLTHLLIDVNEVLTFEDVPIGDITTFPSLIYLRLWPSFSTPYIVKLLQSMPKLRTFILDFLGPAADLNSLFDSMVVNHAFPNFTPHLENFAVHLCDTDILLDASTLARLLCSRSQDLPSNYTPLKKFTLIGRSNFLMEIDEEIERVSGMTSLPVEINLSSLRDAGPLEDLELPNSYFVGGRCDEDCYGNLVDHESWLA